MIRSVVGCDWEERKTSQSFTKPGLRRSTEEKSMARSSSNSLKTSLENDAMTQLYTLQKTLLP